MRDLSPILPGSVSVVFPGKRCTGTGDIPETWTKTVDIDDVPTPPIAKGGPGVKLFRDKAPALFAGGGSTPTNSAQLESLAKRIAQDHYDWRESGTDRVYNGIVKVAQDGNVDLTEWTYHLDRCETRAIVDPYNDDPEELTHVGTDCVDKNCVEIYEPSIFTSGPNRLIYKYLLCKEGNKLVRYANGTDQISGCCGGGGGTFCGCWQSGSVPATLNLSTPYGSVVMSFFSANPSGEFCVWKGSQQIDYLGYEHPECVGGDGNPPFATTATLFYTMTWHSVVHSFGLNCAVDSSIGAGYDGCAYFCVKNPFPTLEIGFPTISSICTPFLAQFRRVLIIDFGCSDPWTVIFPYGTTFTATL